MKKIDLPIEEIVKKYNEGTSQRKLAKEYSVSPMTISNRILEYYGRPRYTPKRKPLPIEEIVKKYEARKTEKDIASQYGVAPQTISKKLVAYYKKTGKTKPERSAYKKKLPIKKIIKENKQGMSQRELASQYSVSQNTISQRIIKYYKSIGKLERKQKKTSPIKDISIEDIIKKYEGGIFASIIAEEYGISESTISKMINEFYIAKGLTKPRLLRNVTTIVDYLNKGLTIEQIKEIAGKKNIIIPQIIIDTALDKTKNKNLNDDDDAR